MDDPGYRVSGLPPLAKGVDKHAPEARTKVIQTRVCHSRPQETDSPIHDKTKESKGYNQDNGCDDITRNTEDRILGGMDGGFHRYK